MNAYDFQKSRVQGQDQVKGIYLGIFKLWASETAQSTVARSSSPKILPNNIFIYIDEHYAAAARLEAVLTGRSGPRRARTVANRAGTALTGAVRTELKSSGEVPAVHRH